MTECDLAKFLQAFQCRVLSLAILIIHTALCCINAWPKHAQTQRSLKLSFRVQPSHLIGSSPKDLRAV